MNKSVLIVALLAAPVSYGLLSAGAPWWAVTGLIFFFAVIMFNMVAYVVLAGYWQIFARLSASTEGNLKHRLNEIFERRENENNVERHKNTLLGMVNVGTATFKVLNAFSPASSFYLHILLSALIFYAAYASGYVVIALIILFAEIISYNCIYWLSKHRHSIVNEVEQAIEILESDLKSG